MWKTNITNLEEGLINISANKGGFTHNSIIKTNDVETFVETAKDEYIKYQEVHKDNNALELEIEALLNK